MELPGRAFVLTVKRFFEMRNAGVLSVFEEHSKRNASTLSNRVIDIQNCLGLYFRSVLGNAN